MSLWPFNRACRCADGLSSLRDEAASASSPEASIPHAEVPAMSPARLLAKSLTDCETRGEWVREYVPSLLGYGHSTKYRNDLRDITVTNSIYLGTFGGGGESLGTPFSLSAAEEKVVREAIRAFDRRANEDRQASALARLTAPRKGLQRDSGETAKTGSTRRAKARSPKAMRPNATQIGKEGDK